MGQIEIGFNTTVETELFLDEVCEVSSIILNNIITNSSPTETFNVDNESESLMIIIRISNIVFGESTSRELREERSINRTHDSSIRTTMSILMEVISVLNTNTLSEYGFRSSTFSIPLYRNRMSIHFPRIVISTFIFLDKLTHLKTELSRDNSF